MFTIGRGCCLVFLFGLVASKPPPMSDTLNQVGYLRPEDFDNVGNRQYVESNRDENTNPNFFEGDIEYAPQSPEHEDAVMRPWPTINGLVTVPYEFTDQSCTKRCREALAKAVTEFAEKTCVRLVPRNGEADFIFVTENSGGDCYVRGVGNWGGEQILSCDLRPGAFEWGSVVHEFMHKLGFHHEHTRPDREKWITIDWNNLEKYDEEHGTKWGRQYVDCREDKCRLSTPDYDYASIMHYGPNLGDYTILRAKPDCPKPPCKLQSQRVSLSQLDIAGINAIYQCPATNGPQNRNCFDVKVTTKDYGNENSWSIGSCSSSFAYADNKVYSQRCCLSPGDHRVSCKDSYGDGWHGGFLEIGGKRYCEDFTSGDEKTAVLRVTGANGGVSKTSNTWCTGTSNPAYGTKDQALDACRASRDCKGVYDNSCDGNNYYLCPISSSFRSSSKGSCVYKTGNSDLPPIMSEQRPGGATLYEEKDD